MGGLVQNGGNFSCRGILIQEFKEKNRPKMFSIIFPDAQIFVRSREKL